MNCCVNLKYLNLRNCKLQVIHDIGFLKDLIYLDLSHNEIWDVKGLKNLKSLQILKLEKNNIQDLKRLETLKEMPTIISLSLQSIDHKDNNKVCLLMDY